MSWIDAFTDAKKGRNSGMSQLREEGYRMDGSTFSSPWSQKAMDDIHPMTKLWRRRGVAVPVEAPC